MFETIEGERVADGMWYAEVLHEYQRIGFLTPIDDFGAGFAGLNLLADFEPDIVKLDMDLVRNIDQRHATDAGVFVRQAAVRFVRVGRDICRANWDVRCDECGSGRRLSGRSVLRGEGGDLESGQ